MHDPGHHYQGFLRRRIERRGVVTSPSGEDLSHLHIKSQDDEVCFGTPGDKARSPTAPDADTNFDRVMGGPLSSVPHKRR